jgi:hypothetical protein
MTHASGYGGVGMGFRSKASPEPGNLVAAPVSDTMVISTVCCHLAFAASDHCF